MAGVTELALLAAWESGVGRPAVDRAVALAALASGLSPDDVADLPLGACDLLLLRLREQCFGPHLDGLADCPDCHAELDVRIDIDELRVDAEPAAAGGDKADGGQVIEVAGAEVRLRPLTSRDVRACGADRDRLLARCVAGGPENPAPDLLAAVEASLDLLDPQAAVALTLDCPMCGTAWQAPVDVIEFVWSEVHRFAHRLLSDVHTLARAYGWSEFDVLAVSPPRRRFYLQACGR
jgi:hypothetical protein